MNENVSETEKLLNVIADLGKEMLMCGAEVNRVEDTVSRLCKAYNLRDSEIFSITSLILVSVKDSHGKSLSVSRRITSYVINLYRLEELNALSRTVCASRPSSEDFATMLDEIIKNSHFNKFLRLLGFILGSGGYSVLFGGSIKDGLFSAIISIVMFGIERFFTHIYVNALLYNFLSSFAAGILAFFFSSNFVGCSMDKIMIGDIMILIPGLVLTNAIRDMMSGDTMAGFLRLCEALLTAIAIALGFVLSMTLTGVIS
jgi:uncharacterized membrane protein YjjP (DUF1212 family)